jgi:hypothetical protein
MWGTRFDGRLSAGCGFVGEVDGAAGRGDVGVGFGDGDPGLLVDVADDLGGTADDAKSAGVGGGEIETVEEGVGSLLVDAAGGERIDYARDGELDGLPVLQCGELEEWGVAHLGGLEVDLVAVEVVAAVKAVVEIAEDGSAELDGAALEAIGLDVTADLILHVFLPCDGYPPGGWVVKSRMDAIVSENGLAKCMHPC